MSSEMTKMPVSLKVNNVFLLVGSRMASSHHMQNKRILAEHLFDAKLMFQSFQVNMKQILIHSHFSQYHYPLIWILSSQWA